MSKKDNNTIVRRIMKILLVSFIPFTVNGLNAKTVYSNSVSHSRLKTGSMLQGQRSRLISPSDKAKAFELR